MANFSRFEVAYAGRFLASRYLCCCGNLPRQGGMTNRKTPAAPQNASGIDGFSGFVPLRSKTL